MLREADNDDDEDDISGWCAGLVPDQTEPELIFTETSEPPPGPSSNRASSIVNGNILQVVRRSFIKEETAERRVTNLN